MSVFLYNNVNFRDVLHEGIEPNKQKKKKEISKKIGYK